MRKRIINSRAITQPSGAAGEWLELDKVATAEVTSEDPDFPIESALVSGKGWRAAQNGQQTIRLIFDKPQAVHRIRLEFSEAEFERTQEFTLKWSNNVDGPFIEIVRQQWNFSPQGSTSEVEDYPVQLQSVAVLELTIRPSLDQGSGVASLSRWLVG
jgi:hypothetical protein